VENFSPVKRQVRKMRNGKTSQCLKVTLPIETPCPPRPSRDRPSCHPTFVVVAAGTAARPRERTRQIVKRWARRTGIPPRRAPMALFHRRRTSITPLSRGPQFTGRDSSAFLKCLCDQRSPPSRVRAISEYACRRRCRRDALLFLFVCRLP
jgi:hypothetical protein